MKNDIFKFLVFGMALFMTPVTILSQIIERKRPVEWSKLIEGARFMDRFLPMKGNILLSDTWGQPLSSLDMLIMGLRIVCGHIGEETFKRQKMGNTTFSSAVGWKIHRQDIWSGLSHMYLIR